MNINFYNSLTNFLKKRTVELIGLMLISGAVALSISFITYSPDDLSVIYGEDKSNIQNFFGFYGSAISDFLLQSFGLMSFVLIISIMSWGYSLMVKKQLNKILLKLFFVILYLSFGCTFIYIIYNNSFWLRPHGNSGFVGQLAYDFAIKQFPIIDNSYFSFALVFFTTLFFMLASEINIKKI